MQVLCRVHLVPVRGGLLALPRFEVTAGNDNQAQREVRSARATAVAFSSIEPSLACCSILTPTRPPER